MRQSLGFDDAISKRSGTFRSLLLLAAASALFAAPGSASAQSAGKVFCLHQTILPDRTVFFWDATDMYGALALKVRNFDEAVNNKPRSFESWKSGNDITVIQSNAAVIIFDGEDGPRRKDTDSKDVAWAEGAEWSVPMPYGSISMKWSMESKIKTWVDPRGFVHGVDVLRRHLAYNEWAGRYAKDEPWIEVTGILDRPTLWSESRKLHRLLLATQQKARKARVDAAAGAPAWDGGAVPAGGGAEASALQPAVDALSRYDDELRGVRFALPSVRPEMCQSSPRLIYWPPKGKTLLEQFKDIDHLTADTGQSVIYQNVYKDLVTESVDPSSFDAAAAQKLAQLEIEARRAIRDAAALTEDAPDESK